MQNAIQPYVDIFSDEIERPYTWHSIPGIKGLLEKAPFTDDTDADSANHGSIYAQSMAEHIKTQMFNILNYVPRHKEYWLTQEDFFAGIDLLKLDPERHVIINWGLDFSFFNGGQPIDGLESDNYNGVQVLELPFYGRGNERRLLILQRSDLPQVFFKDISHFQIKMYNAEKLEPLNIQAALVDLHRNKKVRDLVLADRDFTDEQKNGIEKQVYVYIAMEMIVRRKEGMHGVVISPHYSYQQNGVRRTLLNEVKDFDTLTGNDNNKKASK
ncbi:hypothetical protein [Mucilaginibacter sp. L3T2-6]|uniref:hypothetical protein n=1 Tax=Mucilaginibacter sp. L3T2-6 TaxID=3062491 RepID=UPI0026772B01|nr:hypothetical protein [Mucilaginibacter sp. L3T2-6]MDO3645300.1 hypothetical protein [Mucilaginibacter sp. L3T2-6]MDV6217799.1 hypothetical protein [Mucilaginibacter sp. L3T2-6]